MPAPSDVTEILTAHVDGEGNAANRLMPLIYQELRELASRFTRRQGNHATLNATALVHEAYVRMVDQERVDWRSRTHFFAIAVTMLRRVMADAAKARDRVKRRGDRDRITLNEDLAGRPDPSIDLIDLHHALERLGKLSPRQCRVAELRFLTGLTATEVSDVLEISKRTVDNDWTVARAWLANELRESS